MVFLRGANDLNFWYCCMTLDNKMDYINLHDIKIQKIQSTQQFPRQLYSANFINFNVENMHFQSK